MKEKIEKELYKLSLKAYNKGEVPVSCLILKNGKVIAKSYNEKENRNNPIFHAEVVAILKATKKIRNWRLSECEMYVSLEPCDMCKMIIKESRISKIYYLLDNKNSKIKESNYKKIEMNNKVFEELIKSFFKSRR